jgi:Phosphodiester glycosidase
MVHGPDDVDHPAARADPYRRAPVDRPAPLDPFRTREYDGNRERAAHSGPARSAPRESGIGLLDHDPRGPAARRGGGPTSHRKGKPARKSEKSEKSEKQKKRKKVVPARVRRRRKFVRRSLLGVFLLVAGYVGVTIYPYLTQPGTDPASARVAEWGRDHYLGFAVTWLENHTYQPPTTGGRLTASQLAQMAAARGGPPPTGAPVADLPPDIVPLASPPEPGEGVWQPVTTDSSGRPILEKAVLRPDAQHTSELAYVAWMRQSALKFTLNPGYQQPGGSWSTPDQLEPGQDAGLVATWNGGFKLTPNDDALGGFYADGRTALPLVDGQAAEVFYQDGSMKIGQWGRDETMTPNVVGVRENLSLLVDQGQVMTAADAGSGAKWGITINNAFFVPRSGVGMTAGGDIVYVGGADLSVLTLAQLLKAAGAVYGMELDINTAWVSFMTYQPGDGLAAPVPTKLWDFQQPADRYYQSSDRDFVSVFGR